MKKGLQILASLGLAVAVTACGNVNRVPRYEITEPLKIKTFKRQTKHEAQEYFNVWSRDAYSKVTSPIRHGVSPGKNDVLERHGQPDYMRKNFRSGNSDETVEEWAYWDRDVCVQFVQGELVWEGPLTDMDRHRIEFGHPRRAFTQELEAGVRRDIWDYQGIIFDTDGSIVTFSNEKLISQQRY